MFQALYNIIIYPLIQIIEVVYLAVHKVFKLSSCPAGYAIIGVSVAITFLCLPLYVVAEKWQQIERDTQKKLKPGIDRIKAAFKGDEQYMILSTFYKQNHYHPMMALRSSFGLLIQIPFFMAAYQFLSNMDELVGLRFFFIKNLGTPDATFHIGNFPINILPIAMTLINCVAGAIYTKGFGFKDKLQVYGMAAVFLVILYNSPAGLVLYWTMNNVFSLVKNIFYKLKNPLKVLYIICCAAVLGMDYFIYFHHSGFLYRRIMFIILISTVLFIPLILKFVNILLNKVFKGLVEDDKNRFILFIISAVSLCILLGMYIPSTVISASPQEFSFIDNIKSPFAYINTTFWKTFGLCIFWPICIYYLFQNRKVKTCISIVFAFFALGALLNVFIFPGKYGNLSTIMVLDNAGNLKATKSENLINIAVILGFTAVIVILSFFKKDKWTSTVFSFVSVALVILTFVNFGKTSKGFKEYQIVRNERETKITTLSPIFHLSKTEKNVFIIDLDRALGAYFPEILNERPELRNIFDGFTFYPNTASFGGCTVVGSPAMFGGYEYTPKEFMKRKDETMVSKHNEALLAMPVLFGQNGFNVSVTDGSFANYSWISDLRIYKDYEFINPYATISTYTDLWITNHPDLAGKNFTSKLIKRNLFWYSIMRAFPTIFRDTIYNDSKYWNAQKSESDLLSVVNNYAALDFLPELTDFKGDKPSYTFIVNELTHEPAYLQAPDYVPSRNVTNIGSGIYHDEIHYHANIAAILRVSEFLDYLKQNNVYDNSKIIIVSDHGAGVYTEDFKNQKSGVWNNCSGYNPLLIVKDYNQHGEIKFNYDFMTNADVAALSVKDTIENAVNPFSKKEISIDAANKEKQKGIDCLLTVGWAPDAQNKTTYKVKGCFTLKDDIFNPDNWKECTIEEFLGGDDD